MINDLITGLRQIKKHAFPDILVLRNKIITINILSRYYIVFMILKYILKYKLFLKIGTYMDILYHHAFFPVLVSVN